MASEIVSVNISVICNISQNVRQIQDIAKNEIHWTFERKGAENSCLCGFLKNHKIFYVVLLRKLKLA